MGISTLGVTKLSLAAAAQSKIYGGFTGGTFSVLQSVGATKSWVAVAGWVATAGGAGGALAVSIGGKNAKTGSASVIGNMLARHEAAETAAQREACNDAVE